MSVFLLDANVLIALIDAQHVFNYDAERWFAACSAGGWATCATTENAVLRIVGSPRYRNSPGDPSIVARSLRDVVEKPGHRFWHETISLLDPARVDPARLLISAQITDSYLLGLAVAHGGRLATFDRRLVADAVRDGANAVHLIDTGE